MTEVTISKGARRAGAGLLTLVLIVGGGNLWATYALNNSTKAGEQRQAAAQIRQGRLIEHKLCTGFGKLAALKPPAGANKANPSRLFDKRQHAILVGLGADIRCPSKKAMP